MQVAALSGLRRFALENRTPQPVGPHDVRIGLRIVGVCGSDMHYWREGRIGPQVVQFPMVIGHECAGQILEIGARVTRVKTGDRVAVEPGIPCHACPFCHQGKPHLCLNMRFLGAPPVDGAYADQLVMPAECVEKIPDAMTYEVATMLEPFGCSVHCANLLDIQPGDSVGIFGAGPIGLTVAMAARLRGAAR
ncbi:MAG TPA: alcohol dehydrogenase catalytic domain-containing protein, partial [Planctomycetota bacterium]|nr:alcohol dehydrogenase catalytic domain-containing protein [Planctomycetota bacterium]